MLIQAFSTSSFPEHWKVSVTNIRLSSAKLVGTNDAQVSARQILQTDEENVGHRIFDYFSTGDGYSFKITNMHMWLV